MQFQAWFRYNPSIWFFLGSGRWTVLHFLCKIAINILCLVNFAWPSTNSSHDLWYIRTSSSFFEYRGVKSLCAAVLYHEQHHDSHNIRILYCTAPWHFVSNLSRLVASESLPSFFTLHLLFLHHQQQWAGVYTSFFWDPTSLEIFRSEYKSNKYVRHQTYLFQISTFPVFLSWY